MKQRVDRRFGTRPRRALIASSDVALGDLYRSSLESHGWDVELVHDGQSVWRRAVTSPPDVLLLEDSLSDVNRSSLLRRLRGHESTRNLVVIVLANAQENDELDQGTNLGVAARLIKNLTTREQLPDIVRELVERHAMPTKKARQKRAALSAVPGRTPVDSVTVGKRVRRRLA